MKYKLLSPCIFFLLLFSVCRTSLSEPTVLGYERWTQTENLSGAVFQRPPEWYYGIHTDLFKLGSFPDAKPPAPNRLIDIEINKNSDSEIMMDGLWIENTGDFKADSWLVHGLTAFDLYLINDTIDEFFFLDVEAYESAHGVPTKYAAILKRNPHKFEKDLLIEVTLEVLIEHLRDDKWRPIDIDVLHNAALEPSDEIAWNIVRYNAVLVENTGANFKPTVFAENDTLNDVNDAIAGGLQAIDVEPVLSCTHVVINCPVEVDRPCEETCGVDTTYSTIYVHNGLPFELVKSVAEPSFDDVFKDLADRYRRSIDIETTENSEPLKPGNLHSVFLH